MHQQTTSSPKQQTPHPFLRPATTSGRIFNNTSAERRSRSRTENIRRCRDVAKLNKYYKLNGAAALKGIGDDVARDREMNVLIVGSHGLARLIGARLGRFLDTE